YRLLQRIGEGGMGEVWLAEQTRPIHRQVALKIIKAGMDTAQVVARFEAERQALALMSHPAIAQVFDGGVTPQGRPFFAMEYVRGEPITTYCNRVRRDGWNAGVHEPRAGRGDWPRRRYANRRVRARSGLVRAADWRARRGREAPSRTTAGRDPARDPRDRSAAPEHARDEAV